MTDPLQIQIEKLRASLAALEAQRSPPSWLTPRGPMPSTGNKDIARNGASQYVQIALATLSDGATRELAADLLARVERMPGEIVPLIVERAEGNPYYAEEMVNWFIDRGILDPNQEPWRFVASRLKESPLPATLQHLLLTRLSALSEAERAALQRGAIFGRRFWEGGIEALGVRSSAQVLGHLPRGLVEPQPESSLEGEAEWSFSQTLLREVTYESVLRRERPNLHKAAAQWLEEQARRAGRLDEFSGLIGEHCERAGEMSAAANWYLRAGERARTASGLAEARRFFDRALELLPPIDRERRWRALLGREAVLDLLGEREAQKADLVELFELAEALDDDARRAEVHFRQERHANWMSDYRASLSAADETIEAAQRAGNSSLAVRALALKIVPYARLGEVKEAKQTVEAALAQAQAAGDHAVLAFVLERAAVHYTESGDLARAAQLFVQAAEMARRLGDRDVEARAMGNLGYAYVQLGLPKLARSGIEQALALNEALGARRLRTYNLSNLGLACWRSGDGRTARQLEEQALSELRTIGDPYLWAACQMYIGLIAEHVGDYAGAVRRFVEAREGFDKIGMNAVGTDALAGLARCALAQGRLDEARQLAAEVWDYLCERGTAGMEFPTRAYQSVSDVFDALEDRDQSRAAVESGYRELMARAEKISDAEWRKSFLENVPEHRAMVEMWERAANGE
jgi:predicted ATPase